MSSCPGVEDRLTRFSTEEIEKQQPSVQGVYDVETFLGTGADVETTFSTGV
jgi:hypothetical protein